MSRSLLLPALWVASAANAFSCDYALAPPILRTENAATVFIGRVLPTPQPITRLDGAVSLYVDEAFKGVVDGATVMVNSGFGSDCGIIYRPGETYLVFLETPPAGKLPYAGLPSGTERASQAPAVLRWLRNRSKMGNAQLLGTVWNIDSVTTVSHHPLPGAKITLQGNGTTATATADGEGVFQLGGLSHGEYEITTSAPGHFVSPSRIKLEGCCTFPEIAAYVDGHVEGSVRSATGIPLNGIRVELASIWPHSSGQVVPFRDANTAEGGRFSFDGIPPGRYRVGVNVLASATVQQPYAATSRSISLKAEEQLLDFDLTLPEPLGGRDVLVRVLTPDGRRAPRARVFVGDELGYTATTEVLANDEGEAHTVWVKGSNFRVLAQMQDTAGRALISDWQRVCAGKGPVQTSITLHYY